MKRRLFKRRSHKPTIEPMVRLLRDCLQRSGKVEIEYHHQWRTFNKAVKQGYISEDGTMLEKGQQFVKNL